MDRRKRCFHCLILLVIKPRYNLLCMLYLNLCSMGVAIWRDHMEMALGDHAR